MNEQHLNPLIQSVRALAEAVAKRERFSDNWLKAHVVNFDFPALIVALERAKLAIAIATAALEEMGHGGFEDYELPRVARETLCRINELEK